MQTPLEKYKNDLGLKRFNTDPAQEMAVMYLQKLYDELCESPQKNNGLLKRIKSCLGLTAQQQVKGLYFWGGVGRGKTYLVDFFMSVYPLKKR